MCGFESHLWPEDLSVLFPELEGSSVPSHGPDASLYVLLCPQCLDPDMNLTVLATRIIPHGPDRRPSAQVACVCDAGCVSAFVIGADSNAGYAFWTRDVGWAVPVIPGEHPAELLAEPVGDPPPSSCVTPTPCPLCSPTTLARRSAMTLASPRGPSLC